MIVNATGYKSIGNYYFYIFSLLRFIFSDSKAAKKLYNDMI